ncbi:hypothetical protein NDU88_006610 [Pleurodeles waltl]|uniref:Uncharacterized protein n=1 Tax=Pleurodeles waltl TaxID=8319 RepID=A0AAV7N3Z6_PLEWA|nr:hypothetical protein NDU88_006610 [Pleurodeles waltl]
MPSSITPWGKARAFFNVAAPARHQTRMPSKRWSGEAAAPLGLQERARAAVHWCNPRLLKIGQVMRDVRGATNNSVNFFWACPKIRGFWLGVERRLRGVTELEKELNARVVCLGI